MTSAGPGKEEVIVDNVTKLCNLSASSMFGVHTRFGDTTIDSSEPFFEKFISNHGMIPVKMLKSCDGWKPEYEKRLTIKRVHVCKSCRFKSYKGCCPEYSTSNRVMIKMAFVNECF